MTHPITITDIRSAAFAAAAAEHGHATADALMTACLATQADRFIKIEAARAEAERVALLRKLPKADLDEVVALAAAKLAVLPPPTDDKTKPPKK